MVLHVPILSSGDIQEALPVSHSNKVVTHNPQVIEFFDFICNE